MMKDDESLHEKAEVVVRRGYGGDLLTSLALTLFLAAVAVLLWFHPDLDPSLRWSGSLLGLALGVWWLAKLRTRSRLVFAANEEGLYYRPRGTDPTLVLIPWRCIHRIHCQDPATSSLPERLTNCPSGQLMEVHFRTMGAPVLPPRPVNGRLVSRADEACMFCFALPRKIEPRPLLKKLLQLNKNHRRKAHLRRIA